ncbi:MAG: hypothetical protein K6U89_01110 [Chloroflexi bacterium]|nr:hypothetical protein [Chloroflexota bacterium]
MTLQFTGPLLSVAAFAPHRTLFEGVFGLEAVGGGHLEATAVAALWGVRGHRAETLLLETPGTGIGVLLVRFDPPAPRAIREGARGIDHDALKVIDFVTSDLAAATAALEQAGFPFVGPPASYQVPGGNRYREGHLHGPDGVICAVLALEDEPLERYVQATSRLFSEILGVSAPVAEVSGPQRFYEALGLRLVLEYQLEDEGFGRMIGAPGRVVVRGLNYGLAPRAPMIGLIQYGLPPGMGQSLAERAVLPNRGLAALRFRAPTLPDLAALTAAGATVLAPPAVVELSPWGVVRSLTVRAPHGVIHHFVAPA